MPAYAAACQTAFDCPATRDDIGARTQRMLDIAGNTIVGYEPFFDVRLLAFPEFAHAAPIYDSVAKLRDRLAVPLPNEHTDRYAGFCREHGCWIQTGSFLEADPNHPECVFNTTVLVGPDGVKSKYRKVNPWLPWELHASPHDIGATAAEAFPVVETEIGRIGVAICYDWLFPETIRQIAFHGAEIIVRVSAYMDPWGATPPMDWWTLFNRARAAENTAFVVAANQGAALTAYPPFSWPGGSMIVDYDGRILAQADPGPGEKVVVAPIDIEALRAERARRRGHDMLAHLRTEVHDYARPTRFAAAPGHPITAADVGARIERARAGVRRDARLGAFLLSAALGLGAVGGCSSGGDNEPAPPPGTATDDAALRARHAEGVAYMGRYEYGPACAAFSEVVAAHPEWTTARINLAIATLNRQEDDDEQTAISMLRDVLKVAPASVRAKYCLGLLLHRNGEIDAASALFEAVAAADPQDPFAAYFVGQCAEEADPETALGAYERAIERDPYFRSAYYRAYQVMMRLGRRDEAAPYFDAFRRLDNSPRARTFEMKYSRMGEKADAAVLDPPPGAAPGPHRGGAVFGPATATPADATIAWAQPAAGARGDIDEGVTSVTACDVDGDGRLDVFIAGASDEPGRPNVLLLGGRTPADHPLCAVTDVRAVAWGDYDNDGLVDAYFGRTGANALFRQAAAGTWVDVTDDAGAGGADFVTIDVVFVDADHDGDLDVFCANADGPDELFSNNLDGTFRTLAQEQGIAGTNLRSRRVLFADLDADRDDDLIVLKAQPPHAAYVNDRLWTYRAAKGMDALLAQDIVAISSLDANADGRVELLALGPDGALERWTAHADGTWSAVRLPGAPLAITDTADLAVADVTGDSRAEFVITVPDGLAVLKPMNGRLELLTTLAVPGGAAGWTLATMRPESGPAAIAQARAGGCVRFGPGPGRGPFAALTFTGLDLPGEPARSNASGLGTTYAARVGGTWNAGRVSGRDGGPGRSLQPVPIGLADHGRIDFVNVEWSNSILQTEMALAPGAHEIAQTQRQLSSCPVLFAWDGTRYRFISDLLGVGGMGYLVEPGVYAPPRPRERFLLPDGAAAPRNGAYALKLGEPMEEACYLDAVTLERWRVPPGWTMFLDERMAILGPEPTGSAVFARSELEPARVTNDRGADVTGLVRTADLRAAPVGPLDTRFIGRLERAHVLEVEFGAALTDADGRAPWLVIDGWVEYPYSQTMFAAWQAGASYDAPSLDARSEDGSWHLVHEQFGYPAGMPRRMALPLTGLPSGTTALRLRTNQEIYWDRIAIAWAEPCPEARREVLPLRRAVLTDAGFPRRTTAEQRVPHYDDADRVPFWDTRAMAGFYTRLGDVAPLLNAADSALVIFGPGEDVEVEFAAPNDVPPAGWSEFLVLDARGWCKDMDLYTGDGETVRPVPGAPGTARERLHERFNTRWRSGD